MSEHYLLGLLAQQPKNYMKEYDGLLGLLGQYGAHQSNSPNQSGLLSQPKGALSQRNFTPNPRGALSSYVSPVPESQEWQRQHAERLKPTGIFDELNSSIGGDYGRGNIHLNDRNILVRNPEQYSSLESVSFNVGDKELLLPTISNDGTQLTPQQAIEQYRKTGQHLGIFNSREDATKYAIELERRQRAYYESGPGKKILEEAYRRFNSR